MPRTARAIEAGMIYHVLNRGNGRMRLFHKAEDYDAFERVLAEGLGRFPVDLLTYCLMPNHWHLVMRPRTDAVARSTDGMGWRHACPTPPRALPQARRGAPVPGALQELPCG